MAWWPPSQWGKGKKDNDADQPHGPNAQTLTDIVRGMQHSVNMAQVFSQQQHQDILGMWFDDDGKPLTRKFPLPDGTVMEWPLVALVKPRSLDLDEMYVEMAVRMDSSIPKKHRTARGEETPHNRTSFRCSFTPMGHARSGNRSNAVVVKMKFKAGDPPEAVARIIEEYTNRGTDPRRPESPEEPSPESPGSGPEVPPDVAPEGEAASPDPTSPPPDTPAGGPSV